MAEKTEKNAKRLQFDFSPEAVERLDHLKELIGAQTRAEVIRNALKTYDWILTEVEPNNIVEVHDEKEQKVKNTIRGRFLR